MLHAFKKQLVDIRVIDLKKQCEADVMAFWQDIQASTEDFFWAQNVRLFYQADLLPSGQIYKKKSIEKLGRFELSEYSSAQNVELQLDQKVPRAQFIQAERQEVLKFRATLLERLKKLEQTWRARIVDARLTRTQQVSVLETLESLLMSDEPGNLYSRELSELDLAPTLETQIGFLIQIKFKNFLKLAQQAELTMTDREHILGQYYCEELFWQTPIRHSRPN